MSSGQKRRGCSGTIFLLLAVFFISTVFVDLDASDINKTYSTTQNHSGVTLSQQPTKAETTDGSLSSVNFNTTSTTSTTQSTTLNLINSSDNDIRFTEADRLYNQLDSEQKEIYNELLEKVADGELSFRFEDTDYQDFQYAFYAFLFEHPEFFWLELNPDMSIDFSGNLKVDLNTYKYWTYSNDRDGYIERLNEKVDEILQGAAHCNTDYDKVKYVHDYLVTNITYDKDALGELEKSMKGTNTEMALSIYGALVNGKCVCGGYAESFYYLTRALGVNSYYIQGYCDTEYHAWNYLEIEGEYYYLDATWDDHDDPDYPKGISYNYFCVTQDELFVDHTPDKNYPAPDCNGTKYNYHRGNYLYFTEYDFEAIRNAINDQLNQQFRSVRFSNKQAYSEAFNDLFNNNRVFEIESIQNSSSIKYYTSDELYTIIVCLK